MNVPNCQNIVVYERLTRDSNILNDVLKHEAEELQFGEEDARYSTYMYIADIRHACFEWLGNRRGTTYFYVKFPIPQTR